MLVKAKTAVSLVTGDPDSCKPSIILSARPHTCRIKCMEYNNLLEV